jgi:hypothetical protein
MFSEFLGNKHVGLNIGAVSELRVRSDDSYCGFHGRVDAAMIGICPSLGKSKGVCITGGKAVGSPCAIITRDSVGDRVSIGPGDSRTSCYGQGNRIEGEFGYGYFFFAGLDGW